MDTDDDDDNIVPYFFCSFMRGDRVPSVRIFYEDVLPDFSSLDFSKHFRLTKQTFTCLFQEIEKDFAKDVRLHGKQLTEKRPMVGLWYLFNTPSMREISAFWNFSIDSSRLCS